MIRKILRVVGVLALLAIAIAAAAIGEIEWKAHAAASDGAPPLSPEERAQVAAAASAGAPVLILLHGAGLNGHMWDAVRRSLDPRWQVIALDLPGNGAHRDRTYSLESSTASIVAVAHAVAPAPVLLVGDSLGGYSAMAAASAVPREQLKGMVIGGSSANFGMDQLPSYVGGLLLIRALTLFADEDKLAARALGNFPLSDANKAALIAGGMSIRGIPPAGRALMGVDFRARLAELDAPVLVINGTLDKRSMAQEDSFVAAARRSSRVHFENCEHGVTIRQPAEFARELNRFAALAFSS